MGLEGAARADFKGLPPGKTLDFFPVGNGKPLRDSQSCFDAAVCLADFAIRTNFRFPSTFQDTSITPYLISCGATQTAPAIMSLYRPPYSPAGSPPTFYRQVCLQAPALLLPVASATHCSVPAFTYCWADTAPQSCHGSKGP